MLRYSLTCNNMKNKLLPLFNKLFLHKCSIIQTIKGLLKNIPAREHFCHRSPFNFFISLVAGLVDGPD
ncbi:transposase [Nitrosomonas sp. Nm34]|uniref:transposase n=1 Tax=Nitrosomonas sp. Nm34 TaxID=1881055 RepID=UPI000B81A7BB